MKLEEFDFEIVYKQGKLNTNADALSRIEVNNTSIIELSSELTEEIILAAQQEDEIVQNVRRLLNGEQHTSWKEKQISNFRKEDRRILH
jgi:hypothetical protein